MEEMDDSVSSTGFQPLFIQEDEDPDRARMEQRVEGNIVQSGLTFAGRQLNQSTLIKPYLQEMDELLKSCEELTGIPFGSHFSANYHETSLGESTQTKEEVMTKSFRETNISPHAYLSTSYIDTNMDKAGAEDQPQQDQLQGPGSITNRCGVTIEGSCQTDMPLTSAGNKLSDTMVEYEGQLLGMLAMLEGCMEETGMDFEPQDWAADASQEYVHISKNPHFYRGTTLASMQPAKTMKLESQPFPLQCWAGKDVAEDGVSRESRNQGEVDSATKGYQQNPSLTCDKIGGSSVERMERSGVESCVKFEQGVLDPQLRFSVPPMPLDGTENDPMYCERMKTGYLSTSEATYKEDITETAVDDTELPEKQMLKMDTVDLRSGMNELGALRSQMEECIEEVQRLENSRKELLSKVLELRGQEEAKGSNEEETEEQIESKVAELMMALKSEEQSRREERKREIQGLREERAEEERRLWKVNLERQGVQEELRKLKRRLFTIARDCAHSQVALNTQHREVELLKREEEKLQSLVLQLTEEGSQLRSTHQQQLFSLQAQLHAQSANQTSSSQEEMTQCKRHSCGDIQQYLQSGLRALEDRYEPMLLALLNRREATAGALVKAKEQAQELKAQLRPLKEDIEKLKLQRACLEEKLNLVHIHRREDVAQYKEMVYCLEESSRGLKTELTIQKRKTQEIEELRDSLTKQLLLYRAAIEDHKKRDHEEKT
ncbi:syncoilin [Scomber scombrus]|uniref:Syncoilin n=1 Tax=Scomber scombrus TaxID=13677 RepID=A0AAV1NP58_SCOSC